MDIFNTIISLIAAVTAVVATLLQFAQYIQGKKDSLKQEEMLNRLSSTVQLQPQVSKLRKRLIYRWVVFISFVIFLISITPPLLTQLDKIVWVVSTIILFIILFVIVPIALRIAFEMGKSAERIKIHEEENYSRDIWRDT